jgi:hypothetical protein
MIKNQELTANEVFSQFSEVMYQWNLMAIKMKEENMPYNVRVEKMKSDINEIFDKYLTQRKRTYGRQTGPHFSNPPEYNPATNEIISCNIEDKKTYIEVQETVGFKRKLRYTLQKKNDEWRIDKRESYGKSDDKWDIIPL